MNSKLKTFSKKALSIAVSTVRDAALHILVDALSSSISREAKAKLEHKNGAYYRRKIVESAIENAKKEIESEPPTELREETKDLLVVEDAGFVPTDPINLTAPTKPLTDLWDDPDAILSVASVAPAVEVAPVVPATSNFVPRTKEQLWADAQKAVETMDASEGLADLDGSVGRIAVDAKRMINCRADLNQLIPFKYGFAWQSYLKSTERHWTFQEVRLENDKADWSTATPAEAKTIVSAIYSLELNSVFLNNDAILNIYRFLTNPEARQYLLRQRAELSVWGNFVHAVMDEYTEQLANTESGVQRLSFNDGAYRAFFSQDQVATRQANRRSIQIKVSDPLIMQHASDSIEDRWEVVVCLVLQYLVFGLVYNYTSLIQLLSFNKVGKYSGLTQGAHNILRDLAMHTEFSMLCVNQILEENADILTADNIESLRKTVNHHVKVEMEYMDWWANVDLPECKFADQVQTLQFLVDRYLLSVGIPGLFNQSRPNIEWFVKLYDSFIPDLHSGGNTVLSASGTGGSLEW